MPRVISRYDINHKSGEPKFWLAVVFNFKESYEILIYIFISLHSNSPISQCVFP